MKKELIGYLIEFIDENTGFSLGMKKLKVKGNIYETQEYYKLKTGHNVNVISELRR